VPHEARRGVGAYIHFLLGAGGAASYMRMVLVYSRTCWYLLPSAMKLEKDYLLLDSYNRKSFMVKEYEINCRFIV
jgi:hypothetical protein